MMVRARAASRAMPTGVVSSAFTTIMTHVGSPGRVDVAMVVECAMVADAVTDVVVVVVPPMFTFKRWSKEL